MIHQGSLTNLVTPHSIIKQTLNLNTNKPK